VVVRILIALGGGVEFFISYHGNKIKKYDRCF